jgi:UDP-2,4-diacetamido-2,4,6-trideoxy-beta-L-altropyranose hydrolase
VLVDVEDMAALMASSDLAIGAAGSTAWERCCLGLPSIAIALASNQRAILRALQQGRVALALDLDVDGGPRFNASLAAAVAAAAEPRQLQSLGAHAAAVVDGLGVQRVADLLARHMGRS